MNYVDSSLSSRQKSVTADCSHFSYSLYYERKPSSLTFALFKWTRCFCCFTVIVIVALQQMSFIVKHSYLNFPLL